MGTITVSGQLNTFILSLIFGAAYCVLYDVLRTMHKTLIKSYLAVFVADLFYWIVITLSTCSFALLFSKGEIRGYWLFGFLVGFILFRITLSRFVIVVFNFLSLILTATKKWVVKLLNRIFKKLNGYRPKISMLFKKMFKRRKKHLERIQDGGV